MCWILPTKKRDPSKVATLSKCGIVALFTLFVLVVHSSHSRVHLLSVVSDPERPYAHSAACTVPKHGTDGKAHEKSSQNTLVTRSTIVKRKSVFTVCDKKITLIMVFGLELITYYTT